MSFAASRCPFLMPRRRKRHHRRRPCRFPARCRKSWRTPRFSSSLVINVRDLDHSVAVRTHRPRFDAAVGTIAHVHPTDDLGRLPPRQRGLGDSIRRMNARLPGDNRAMSHSSLSPGLSRRRSAVLATLIVLLAAAAWATHQHDRFAEAAAIASAPAAGVLLVGRTRGWFSHRRDSNTTGPWPTGAKGLPRNKCGIVNYMVVVRGRTV